MPAKAQNVQTDPLRWLQDHGDALFRYALLRIGDQTVAEELVQETLLAALGAQERFAGRSSERTWFLGILKHKTLDYFRRCSREQRVSDLPGEEYEIDDLFNRQGVWRKYPRPWPALPEETLENREFWEAFHRCLSGLPQRLAEVFALRELDEMETEEICDLLQVSATNVWTILHRARLRLRQCLEVRWFNPKKADK